MKYLDYPGGCFRNNNYVFYHRPSALLEDRGMRRINYCHYPNNPLIDGMDIIFYSRFKYDK